MKITEESMNQKSAGIPEAAPEPHLPPDSTPPQKSEKEKLRSMSGRDRVWYIWAYYKFHILAVVVAVGLICSVGSAFYNSSFKTVLYCIYVNSRGTEAVNAAPLEEGFAGHLGLGKKELITTEVAFISFDDSATDYSYASMAKITALVASQELDILIGDEESIRHYASVNGFTDLAAELSPDVLDLAADRLFYAEGEDGRTYPCAIDLSGTAFAAGSNLAQEPPLLGIIANSGHKDTAEALIRYIFAP